MEGLARALALALADAEADGDALALSVGVRLADGDMLPVALVATQLGSTPLATHESMATSQVVVAGKNAAGSQATVHASSRPAAGETRYGGAAGKPVTPVPQMGAYQALRIVCCAKNVPVLEEKPKKAEVEPEARKRDTSPTAAAHAQVIGPAPPVSVQASTPVSAA